MCVHHVATPPSASPPELSSSLSGALWRLEPRCEVCPLKSIHMRAQFRRILKHSERRGCRSRAGENICQRNSNDSSLQAPIAVSSVQNAPAYFGFVRPSMRDCGQRSPFRKRENASLWSGINKLASCVVSISSPSSTLLYVARPEQGSHRP